ncbi:MAG TPA: SDR family oxidoreductase [Allosphingosinicella sp.]|nr:SDR family oxidoreductase [Allosphingosinicella sp.]
MGKRILITGCSSGIGRALAVELTARGHEVIATARRLEALADLDVTTRLQLDVTDEASVADAVAAAGPVDILVNNAGVGFWGPVETASGAEVQALFETNVFGPLRVLRALLPGMRARGAGAIVQISSAAAQRSNALLGHYAATKAALEAHSLALRIELAPFGIKVTMVVLGAVETEFGHNRIQVTAPEYADLAERFTKRIVANRSAPTSAAAVAVTLADAIDAGDYPLRIDATPDAAVLIAQRRGLSDSEWERSTLAALGACGVGWIETDETGE